MAFTSFPAGVLALGAHFWSFPCLSRTLPLTEGIAVVCTLACGSGSSDHLRARGCPSPWALCTPIPEWSSLLESDPWG